MAAQAPTPEKARSSTGTGSGSSSSSGPVPTSQQDFLEQDAAVRGQSYVCLSFLSPEDAIASKNAHAVSAFMRAFCRDFKTLYGDVQTAAAKTDDPALAPMLDSLAERYAYALDPEAMKTEFDSFCRANDAVLHQEYARLTDDVCSIRGIKVRGSYETEKEARHRAQQLMRTDPNFDVYVASVGC